VEVTSVEESDLMILSAREWGGFAGTIWNSSPAYAARCHGRGAVLGQTAAEVLKKKVGDPIQIETKKLTVVGS
jgi:putative ABC transport system permease protein